jgi:RNA polymerase sigma factor (sigma-70 family)
VDIGEAGDDGAFLALIDARRLAWYGLARRITPDPQLAEDCLQQALLLAWRHRAQLRDAGAADAWVRRILVRTARGARAGAFTTPLELPSRPGVVEERVLDRWSLAQAAALIEALPPRQRRAVLDRLVEDLPYSSIAERLGCTEATARSLVRFGLAHVRPRLRQAIS